MERRRAAFQGVLASLPLQVNGTRGPDTSTPTNETVQVAKRFLPWWIPEWSIRFTVAVMTLLVAWYLSKLVVRLLRRRVTQYFRRPSIVQTILRSVRMGIMLVALFIAAGITGFFRIGNLLISATVLTGATILVLTPIISSVVNGLLILTDQPYEIGDMIELAETTDRTQVGQRGFVENITLRYTKIFTHDNTFIVIPNGTIRDRDVINYSAEDPRTRLELDVLVTYESDLEEAQDLIERGGEEVDGVISGGPTVRIGSSRYPAAPMCFINEFAAHGVRLTLLYWVRDPYTMLAVRSQIQENIWAMLDDADVEIAYPHSHVYFDETSGELPLSFVDPD